MVNPDFSLISLDTPLDKIQFRQWMLNKHFSSNGTKYKILEAVFDQSGNDAIKFQNIISGKIFIRTEKDFFLNVPVAELMNT